MSAQNGTIEPPLTIEPLIVPRTRVRLGTARWSEPGTLTATPAELTFASETTGPISVHRWAITSLVQTRGRLLRAGGLIQFEGGPIRFTIRVPRRRDAVAVSDTLCCDVARGLEKTTALAEQAHREAETAREIAMAWAADAELRGSPEMPTFLARAEQTSRQAARYAEAAELYRRLQAERDRWAELPNGAAR
ncbi:hypothetical protein [Amycolatopsis sp. NPDC004378]